MMLPPSSLNFSELPYGDYEMYRLIDNKTNVKGVNYSKTYFHNRKKNIPEIGEMFYMKNYLDSYLCTHDGTAILCNSLIDFITSGGTHTSWLLVGQDLANRLLICDRDPDKVNIILALESL